ncbi:hypothetical protein A2U01_0075051, partial [Trifolium medium]|nr:hypothetical protein [Trifolium medium]
NKPEVEVPAINEEKIPVQMEPQETPVIEATPQGPPQNMAQHDAIIADALNAERDGDLNLEGAHSTNGDQKQPQVNQEDKAKSAEPTSSADYEWTTR